MKTIEELQFENDSLKTEIAAHKAENEVLSNINKELTLEIENLKAAPEEPLRQGFVNKLSFEFEKVTYGFQMPGVNLDGEIVTAAQVVKDKKLQKKLIERQSGMIAVIS